jgi:hypothetical protein
MQLVGANADALQRTHDAPTDRNMHLSGDAGST